MFQQIEKEYKKLLKENKFGKFYWICATTLIIFSTLFKNFFIERYYLVYIILGILIITYFIVDYHKTLKNIKRSKTNLIGNLKVYINQIPKNRINNLINNMKKYNIKTKNDIKLIIDYYNNKQPIKVESSFLGWLVSAILTLSSFIQIAYDSEKQTLDYTKISIILGSSLGIILCFLIPLLLIKSVINGIVFSNEKLHSNLSEDLTYIYFNFNRYKNQLNK